MGGSCDVVDCDGRATGSYLHARRDNAVRFAICDTHLGQLRDGGHPVVVDSTDGRRPTLRIQ